MCGICPASNPPPSTPKKRRSTAPDRRPLRINGIPAALTRRCPGCCGSSSSRPTASVLVHADAGGDKLAQLDDAPDGDRGHPGAALYDHRSQPRGLYGGPARDRARRGPQRNVAKDMGSPDEDVALAKDGVEVHLQELLAEQPQCGGEDLRLVRRELADSIYGPVDWMCRDAEEAWVAVLIKPVAGTEAVEQLVRHLQLSNGLDPAFAECWVALARCSRSSRRPACSRLGARNRAHRGRSGGPANGRETRAGTGTVLCMNDEPAVLTERRERVLLITIQPARTSANAVRRSRRARHRRGDGRVRTPRPH